MKYKVVIVDDEEPARALLNVYAQKMEDLEVVAVHSNALDAIRTINNEEVDILLTDIQMDDLTGIDLIKNLKQQPVTIFTTAYSEYALEGYELDVVDYLVKPISFQRFTKSLGKAIELCQFSKNIHDETENSEIPNSDFFFVKTNRKIVKVEYNEVLFVQSYGEYVKIYTRDDVILALQTTSFMEKLLPSDRFIRVHRSSIINIHHIFEIEGNMVKIDKHTITISKRMRENFMSLIGEKGLSNVQRISPSF